MRTRKVKLESTALQFKHLMEAADGRGKCGTVYKDALNALLRDHMRLLEMATLLGADIEEG